MSFESKGKPLRYGQIILGESWYPQADSANENDADASKI